MRQDTIDYILLGFIFSWSIKTHLDSSLTMLMATRRPSCEAVESCFHLVGVFKHTRGHASIIDCHRACNIPYHTSPLPFSAHSIQLDNVQLGPEQGTFVIHVPHSNRSQYSQSNDVMLVGEKGESDVLEVVLFVGT